MKLNIEIDTGNMVSIAQALELLGTLAEVKMNEPWAKPEPTPAPDVPAPVAPAEPVAPPALPIPPAPIAAPDAQGEELDSQGKPWDAKLHSRTKAKNPSGEWRAKRGTGGTERPTDLEGVLDQALKKADTLPVPPAPPVPTWEATMGDKEPPPSAAEIFAQPPAPTASAIPETFEILMPRLSAACATDPRFSLEIQAALKTCGIPGVTALSTNPEHIPALWAQLIIKKADL